MTGLHIREADLANPEDGAAIVDILDSYAADVIGGGQSLSSEVRARLLPALQHHPTTLVLLALAEGRPVGIAVCFFGLSTFHARPLVNIHDLAVLPDHRGQGVGRALLSEVEARAVARGCCKLTLEVQEDNAPARLLYERYGFGDFVVGQARPTRFLSKTLLSL